MTDQMETVQVSVPAKHAHWYRQVLKIIQIPDGVTESDIGSVAVSFTLAARRDGPCETWNLAFADSIFGKDPMAMGAVMVLADLQTCAGLITAAMARANQLIGDQGRGDGAGKSAATPETLAELKQFLRSVFASSLNKMHGCKAYSGETLDQILEALPAAVFSMGQPRTAGGKSS